jgi:hypothetical protein
MKKLLMLFVFAGLLFSTTSCKKDCPECEEPVLHGAGTWNASKVMYQGQDVTNSGDPTVDCWLTDKIVLNDTQNGTSWDFTDYDSNTSTCDALNLTVKSWAENYDKKILYVTVTYQGVDYNFGLVYVNDNQIKAVWSGGDLEIYYDKQQ